ncbi:MAG: 5-(carboxyamino)imidazole ribonucleotide synthase [Gammaproteobacteria bacterium]
MKRILVLGDGQLGLMLAEAAARLGLVLDRLAPESGLLFRGTGRRAELLPEDWGTADYDLVTAEREHLPQSAWMASARRHPGFLTLRAIDTLADRRSQKALLDRLGIPTATWRIVHGEADIRALVAETGTPLVVKAARGGYDGRGQWQVLADGSGFPPPELYGAMIAERGVRFSRELSLVGARGEGGHCVFYPLVENRHRAGMLRQTIAAARAPAGLQRRAEAMLRKIMDDLDYVGVMAVELFQEDGELLVNELAPRVHNSGHWTQDGASVDQFELHLRALCGWPLQSPAVSGRTVMLNLVGCDFDPAWLALPGARMHWYGKETRPGRKLGHLNFRGESDTGLLGVLRTALASFDPDHALGLEEAIATVGRGARAADQAPGVGSPMAAARRKAARPVSLPR